MPVIVGSLRHRIRSRGKYLGIEYGRYWRGKLREEGVQLTAKYCIKEYQLSEGEVGHFGTQSLNTTPNRVHFHRVLT